MYALTSSIADWTSFVIFCSMFLASAIMELMSMPQRKCILCQESLKVIQYKKEPLTELLNFLHENVSDVMYSAVSTHY